MYFGVCMHFLWKTGIQKNKKKQLINSLEIVRICQNNCICYQCNTLKITKRLCNFYKLFHHIFFYFTDITKQYIYISSFPFKHFSTLQVSLKKYTDTKGACTHAGHLLWHVLVRMDWINQVCSLTVMFIQCSCVSKWQQGHFN